ncbi:MAG: hypothetical protein ICV75_02925 [Nitrospiraceae bacterium]|nr:hypothetical protein [Nitrospiraceae bacterium]
MPPIAWFLRSVHHRTALTRRRVVETIIGAVAVCLGVLLMIGQSRSEMGPIQGVPHGTMVAAGFGSQIGDLSAITVRTYDAVSGVVLSNETFELNVKDEGHRSHPGQGRIFAGGIGVGATDLSNFVLRVYDANTGAFQWEGRLNLSPQERSIAGLPVSTLISRRATVTRIHDGDQKLPQSSFLVRALDTTTGGLVWTDEFSTGAAEAWQAERIAQRLMTPTEGTDETSRTFDLTIRMLRADGQGILWEDQFEQEALQEEAHETVDDHAHILPAWPGLNEQDPIPRDI